MLISARALEGVGKKKKKKNKKKKKKKKQSLVSLSDFFFLSFFFCFSFNFFFSFHRLMAVDPSMPHKGGDFKDAFSASPPVILVNSGMTNPGLWPSSPSLHPDESFPPSPSTSPDTTSPVSSSPEEGLFLGAHPHRNVEEPPPAAPAVSPTASPAGSSFPAQPALSGSRWSPSTSLSSPRLRISMRPGISMCGLVRNPDSAKCGRAARRFEMPSTVNASQQAPMPPCNIPKNLDSVFLPERGDPAGYHSGLVAQLPY